MSASLAVLSHLAPAATPMQCCLFVSTALEYWSTEQGATFARDVQIDNTLYRRLDPEYYAWLRSRMVLAKRAAAAGRLDAAVFEELRTRFNPVHDWAVQNFGKERLAEAVRVLRADEYIPPVAADDQPRIPLARAPKSTRDNVSPEATAMVDAIAETAMGLGWSREALYATGKGTFDPQRGLICYLKPGDRIGEVTAQSVEIIHLAPSEARHRFYNPDADQPWIVRTKEEKK